MAKKLLVRTPKTNNGTTLVYDADKKPVYKESILELAARKGLESINARMPEHLRHEFAIIDVAEGEKGATVDELKKKLAGLEEQSQVLSLHDQIAALEKELAASKSVNAAKPTIEGDTPKLAKEVKADAAIAAIASHATLDEVNAYIAGEERKTVIEAANARIEQLTPKA